MQTETLKWVKNKLVIMDLVMIQIISSFLASVVQKIVLAISYEKVRDGELIKNSKKLKELVDNFL